MKNHILFKFNKHLSDTVYVGSFCLRGGRDESLVPSVCIERSLEKGGKGCTEHLKELTAGTKR